MQYAKQNSDSATKEAFKIFMITLEGAFSFSISGELYRKKKKKSINTKININESMNI